ncbi:pentapeptide repeat-containing protein [Spirosoma gilvum]
MKLLITSLLFALVALSPSLAQTTVDAKDIMAKINRKEAVSYQNATITGDLDLTSLANRKEVRDGNWGESEHYLSTVEVPMTFKNCTFKGKFLGYRTEDHDGKLFKVSNTVYNTDFPEAVTLEGCTFEDDATFKYSTFSQRAIFTNNRFEKIALFKYTKFRNDADFSSSTFQGSADFKYTKFDEASTFQKARFERSADFKYTKFDEGTNFSQARFTGNADFKYTHLPSGSNFDETRFDGSADFKYTTLGGRRFLPSGR